MSGKLILSALFVFCWVTNGAPQLVNAIAAKVGERLITVQDAYVFRGLQRLRSGERPIVLFETDRNLKVTVQKVMFEEMILAEAKAVDFKELDPKQVAEAVKRLKELSGGADWHRLLRTFSLTDAEMVKRVAQGLLAERFLKKKIESLTPVITDSEIDQYTKNYPEKVKKLGEKNRLLISEALKKEKVDKGLQDYIDFLTEKYTATLLLS
ncbi:MAG: hypothetical protein EBQ92_03335 [Proteobacteria bacterium]|nr:hypothetical protein [Pseudomonadota bacterium]